MAGTHHSPPTLHAVAPFITRSLRMNDRGVVVLALDGLPHAPAKRAFTSASVDVARSTFPSTSVTAWLTSVTGADVAQHHAAGMAMRVPGTVRVASLTEDGPDDLVASHTTVFETARADGRQAYFWAPDLEPLSGPWIKALSRGADWLPSGHRDDLTSDPVVAVRRAVDAVDGVRAQGLLWAYVNLDDHLHAHGPDARIAEALVLLDCAARRWADTGRTVIAHADHGQAVVQPRPDLQEQWTRLAAPKYCRAPAGGAGRVRWLYPHPEQAESLRARAADALGDQADVVTFDELAERGLMADTPPLRERVGEIVAIAAGPGFPVYRATDAYDHGATTADETDVAVAVWPPGPNLSAFTQGVCR